MSASYEFRLCDDAGRILTILDKYSFASYTRTTQGYGTIQMGIPFEYYRKSIPDLFKLDWRIDVWRSPEEGFPMRREGSFLLQKFNVYERVDDNLRIIEFFGRSPIEILRRSFIAAVITGFTDTAWVKTDFADDMMKEFVRENLGDVVPGATLVFVAPYTFTASEFTVDGDTGDGPSISYITSWGSNLLDILKDIKATTFTLNSNNSSNKKIYFDVIEGPGLTGGFGYIFKTYANLRGNDRTDSGLIFSTENGNMRQPSYYEDYYDTAMSVYITDFADSNIITSPDDGLLSRWNNAWIGRRVDSSVFTTSAKRQAFGNQELDKYKIQRVLNATFLNTPGGVNQPRSLYGVDWDMGDLVRAEFAGKSMDVEIKIVHVAVDDKGRENVLGKSELSA